MSLLFYTSFLIYHHIISLEAAFNLKSFLVCFVFSFSALSLYFSGRSEQMQFDFERASVFTTVATTLKCCALLGSLVAIFLPFCDVSVVVASLVFCVSQVFVATFTIWAFWVTVYPLLVAVRQVLILLKPSPSDLGR